MNISRLSYLWHLNIVSNVLVFKLCKETRLLSRVHCQTLLSDWLTLFSLVMPYIKWAVKGTWAFVHIHNPLLVMAKIKLIESLRSTERTATRTVQGSENISTHNFRNVLRKFLTVDIIPHKSNYQFYFYQGFFSWCYLLFIFSLQKGHTTFYISFRGPFHKTLYL